MSLRHDIVIVGGGGAGGSAGGSGVVIIKEPAIAINTSGVWTMQAVYTARVGDNWTS